VEQELQATPEMREGRDTLAPEALAGMFMRVEFFLVLLYITLVAVLGMGVTLRLQIAMEPREMLVVLAGRLLV
jgi:hypothetical protein